MFIHQQGRIKMPKYFSVTELARKFDCKPRDITELFYQRRVSDDKAPVIGGRRLIPESLVPEIEEHIVHLLAKRRALATVS